MKKWCVAAALCVAACAATAAPKSRPCYGAEERALAKVMIEIMPFLELNFIRQEQAAKRVRQKTCAAFAKGGRIVHIDYATAFFSDSRNRALLVVAKERNIDPRRLQAALVDLIWPPITA